MVKKKDLEREVHRLAKNHGVTARLVRQGSHEIWECASLTFPIPRHKEIAEGAAQVILKRLEDHLRDISEEG